MASVSELGGLGIEVWMLAPELAQKQDLGRGGPCPSFGEVRGNLLMGGRPSSSHGPWGPSLLPFQSRAQLCAASSLKDAVRKVGQQLALGGVGAGAV